jgi:hypothetical protein
LIKILYALLVLVLTACQAGATPPPAMTTPVVPGSASLLVTPSATAKPSPSLTSFPTLLLPSPMRSPSPSPTPAQRLDLVGQLGGTTQAAFIQGEYVYLNVGPKLVVLDISDPTQPEAVGMVMLPGLWAEYYSVDIYAAQPYVYVGGGKGLYIVDVSQPAAPALVGFYSTPGGVSSVMVPPVSLDTPAPSYAYLTSTPDYERAGMLILDVSNPTAPREVGSYAMPAVPRDVTVVASAGHVYAYVAVDVPCMLPRGLKCKGSLRILDVSDPTAPVEVAFHATPISAQGVVVSDGYAYVTESHCDIERGCESGLEVLDVSDPAAPKRVGVREASTGGVTVVGNYVYNTGLNILLGEDRLHILDVSAPNARQEVGTYDLPGPPKADDVAVKDSYAYALWGIGLPSFGLSVIDVSDPSAPSEVGVGNTRAIYEHIWSVASDYVYLGTDGIGFLVVDVANPAAPFEAGAYELTGVERILGVMDGRAYLATMDGLQVVDLSDPTKPGAVGLLTLPAIRGFMGAALANDYAYVAMNNEGWWIPGSFVLNIFDLADPAAPRLAGVFTDLRPGDFAGVTVANGRVYVQLRQPSSTAPAAGWGMQIVDVSQPARPAELGFYQPQDFEVDRALAFQGEELFLLDLHGNLHLVDVSDPADPDEVAVYAPANPSVPPLSQWPVAISDDYLYVAGGEAGLFILRLYR